MCLIFLIPCCPCWLSLYSPLYLYLYMWKISLMNASPFNAQLQLSVYTTTFFLNNCWSDSILRWPARSVYSGRNAFHCLGKFYHCEWSSKLVVLCNVVCAGDWLQLGTTFAGWWLAVTFSWQITYVHSSLTFHGFVHHSVSPMDRSIRIVQQYEQVVKP